MVVGDVGVDTFPTEKSIAIDVPDKSILVGALAMKTILWMF